MLQFFRTRKDSFLYACQGIAYALRTQPNTRIILAMTAVAFVASFLLRLDALEWAAIIFAVGLVWVAELVNTAVESVLDYLNPPIHPLVKAAKDVSAGAVLLASITALLIGIVVLLLPLITLITEGMP
ncbi:MAG TPA: diacylglycerol kinase family protein [Anaerolineaceae bacterium]|nr:diacylglycerol kinase family protein [Anaerolineaceae bacterium]